MIRVTKKKTKLWDLQYLSHPPDCERKRIIESSPLSPSKGKFEVGSSVPGLEHLLAEAWAFPSERKQISSEREKKQIQELGGGGEPKDSRVTWMGYRGGSAASGKWNGERGFNQQGVGARLRGKKKSEDFKTRCDGLELYPLGYSLRTSVKIGIAFKCIAEKLLMPCNIFVNIPRLPSPFHTVSTQILNLLFFPMC